MKDLNKLVDTCLFELDTIGIKYGSITKWTINTRARKRWGRCSPLPDKKSFEISVSERLLADDISDKSVKTTIIHEILHTCKGCLNHSTEWKKLASYVNSTLGYDIKRCTSAAEHGICDEPAARNVRYIVKCIKCGKTYERERKSKIIKNPQRYRCGVCRGKLVLADPTDKSRN